MYTKVALAGLLLAGGIFSAPARAATYQVGPTRTYATLDDALAVLDLAGGDMVEIDGDVTYPGDVRVRAADGGGPGDPVVIRGISVNGRPPHFSGGTNTISNEASYIVFENIEISGTGNTSSGTFRCFFHQGTGVVIRGAYVHDCPRQGILGADQGSGSLTVEYSRIINSGSDGGNHAIYMATDEVMFPGSVFRLQFSYLRDSQFDSGTIGGNLVKSRAERNEIYYNWLEGAFYHELELIGPDPGGAPPGYSEGLAREDSDVVGNIILHTRPFGSILRFGGDGEGQTFGRYRFVNNTVIRRGGGGATVFRLFDGVGALQADNNVFWNDDGSGLRIIREVEADWDSGGTTITGTNNWIQDGSRFVPSGFAQSVIAANPGFSNLAALDFRPATDGDLVNAGAVPVSPAGFEISNPLAAPQRHPPQQDEILLGVPESRPQDATLDIGAFELPDVGLVFADSFEL